MRIRLSITSLAISFGIATTAQAQLQNDQDRLYAKYAALDAERNLITSNRNMTSLQRDIERTKIENQEREFSKILEVDDWSCTMLDVTRAELNQDQKLLVSCQYNDLIFSLYYPTEYEEQLSKLKKGSTVHFYARVRGDSKCDLNSKRFLDGVGWWCFPRDFEIK